MKAMMSEKLRNILKDPLKRRELQRRLPQLHWTMKQDKAHPENTPSKKPQENN